MPAAKKTTKTAAATDAVTSNVTAAAPKAGSPKKSTGKTAAPKAAKAAKATTTKKAPAKATTPKAEKEAKATPAAAPKAEKAAAAPKEAKAKKMQEAAKAVCQYLAKNGRSTRSQVKQHVEFSSYTALSRYLEAEGLAVEVKREDDKYRHYELTEKGKKVAAE